MGISEAVRKFSGDTGDGTGSDTDRVVVGIPQAGSGVPMYSEWPPSFGTVPFLRYHLPGRDRRRKEPAPDSIEELCDDLTDAVTGLDARSVVLTGHCMGALVADAVAARLRDRVHVRTVLSSIRPAQVGLYGAYTATMTDAEILEIMNRSLAVSGRPLVHQALAGIAVRALRQDVAMLSRYVGEGGEKDYPRTVIWWSEDEFVPDEDRDHWTVLPGTAVVDAAGPPENFLVSGNAAIREVERLLAPTGQDIVR